MLTLLTAPWGLLIRERLGFAHRSQVVTLPAPPGVAASGWLTAAVGHRVPWQRSQRDSTQAFVLLSDLAPYTDLTLRADAVLGSVSGSGNSASEPLSEHVRLHDGILDNGRLRLRLGPVGVSQEIVHAGPITGIAVIAGPWRGGAHLDVRADTCTSTLTLLESGPLRRVVCWSADLGRGRTYACTITLDAGAEHAELDEHFAADPDDQIVWDFAGSDLPQKIWLLNSSAGHQEMRPDLTCDHRLGRVWCWTQYAQLIDRRDGLGAEFSDDTVIGMVALRGGDWRGGKLNHLEAWVRRWWHNDPRTRRGWPSTAKQDATYPDGIPARGVSQCTPRLNFEGWIGQGRRICALVAAPAAVLRPADTTLPEHGPWEQVPDLPRWNAQLGGLRRIHTHHGLFSLQTQLAMTVEWPQETTALPIPEHLDGRHSAPMDLATTVAFLDARLHGMWYGAASQAVNPVVSRPVPGLMAQWSARIAAGLVPPADAAGLRARCAALAYLNGGGHLYPGDLAMLPLDNHDGSEPNFDGMANQNFLTDVLAIVGMMGETHRGHPQAAAWRDYANRLWARQLEFHTYPGSGIWEESHTYFLHVASTVQPWLAARVRNGDHTAFADVNLQRFLGSIVEVMAPPDARLAAQVVMPFGDHGPEDLRWRQVFSAYARELVTLAPELAARLTWAHRVNGGTDPDVMPPAAPPSVSQVISGFGAVLRSGPQDACALRSGGAWGHHHQDDGSVQIWGCGRQLIADASSGADGTPGSRKFPAAGHSRWQPRDLSPVNFLNRHNRGWLVSHDVHASTPWVLAWCPTRWVMIPKGGSYITPLVSCHHLTEPLRHQRLIVQLAPGALLVVDRSEGVEAAQTRWHMCGEPTLHDAAACLAVGDSQACWVVPLLGAQATLGQRDVATKPELSTREVLIDLGLARLSAVVITWGDAVRPQCSDAQVAHAGWSADIVITAEAVRIGTGLNRSFTTITWPAWEA